MNPTMEALLNNWDTILLSVYSVAVTIAAATPTRKDNDVIDRVGNVVGALVGAKRNQGMYPGQPYQAPGETSPMSEHRPPPGEPPRPPL